MFHVTTNQSRYESKTLRQFSSNRFEMNRTWSLSIGAHDRTKNKKVLIFRNTEFTSQQISKRWSTSATCNPLKDPLPPFPMYILYRLDIGIHHVP